MSKKYLSVVLVLIIGLGVGFIIGSHKSYNKNYGKPAEHAHNADGHVHTDVYDVANHEPQPALDILVHKDPKAGWNIELLTTNFVFSPENASLNHVPGEGHAHIYVDGKKIARAYSKWFHVDNLPEGEHTIRVTLNTNDHKDYAVNGSTVEAIKIVGDGDSMMMQMERNHGADEDGHGHP